MFNINPPDCGPLMSLSTSYDTIGDFLVDVCEKTNGLVVDWKEVPGGITVVVRNEAGLRNNYFIYKDLTNR